MRKENLHPNRKTVGSNHLKRETILRITTAMKVIDVHRIAAGRARKSLRRNNLKTVSGWKINKRMKKTSLMHKWMIIKKKCSRMMKKKLESHQWIRMTIILMNKNKKKKMVMKMRCKRVHESR
jgi:hypothetical protein